MAFSKMNYCKIHDLAKDEDLMISYLQEKKLILKEKKCPKCHNLMKLRKIGDAYYFRCWNIRTDEKRRKSKCNEKVSIRKGSWFSSSRLEFGTILKITYGLIKNYHQNDIKEEAEVDKNTICNWASYMRQVLLEWSLNKTEMIGGEGKIVEIDESKFGKRKYNRGHKVEGQWVFGGVERETGKSFLVPVEMRDKTTLLTIIKEWILPGTTIISDCWKAYNCLQDEGFKHLTVNHKLHFVDPNTGAHTNMVEGMWRHAKAFLPQYCRLKKNYASYLAHYSFVKKARSEGRNIFEFFLEEVSKIDFDVGDDADRDCNGIPVFHESDEDDDILMDSSDTQTNSVDDVEESWSCMYN